MALTSLKQITSEDDELRRVQANVSDALRGLQTGPYFGGSVLQVTVVTGSANRIAHGLGRTPQFWTLLDITVNTNVWRSAWDDNFIYLNSGSNCPVKVWVS